MPLTLASTEPFRGVVLTMNASIAVQSGQAAVARTAWKAQGGGISIALEQQPF